MKKKRSPKKQDKKSVSKKELGTIHGGIMPGSGGSGIAPVTSRHGEIMPGSGGTGIFHPPGSNDSF